MTLRRLIAVVFLAVLGMPGITSAATYDTPNFSVDAPSPELARKFGDMAEFYRREKALQWLGREMPSWPRKCPLQVVVNMGGAGGATTFTFGSEGGRGVITSRRMEIRGDVKQLLNSVLPHEITHTVLAEHFGRPVPRWADEGGSVLSENEDERFSHDVKCREYLNDGRGIRLKVLFRMAEYPRDMHVLYAQGFSVTNYLVEKGGGGLDGRGKLLQFLRIGMQGNDQRFHGTVDSWNVAAQQVYGFDTIDAMEAAWLTALRTPPSRIAARNGANGNTSTAAGTSRPGADFVSSNPRTDVRTSAAPAVPVLEPPLRAIRGTAPDMDPAPRASGAGFTPMSRPVAPDYPPTVLMPPQLPPPARP